MNTPFLSICIPTYNGTGCLYENITNILSFESDELEVVVSDNCSTDTSVLDRVMELSDPRLKVYVNERNEGPYKNWYLALKRGTGHYLMLVPDNNSVAIENLEKFIEYFRHNDYDIVKNAFHNVCRARGAISSYKYAYCGCVLSHTGYVMYKKEVFDRLETTPDSFDPIKWDYPYIVWDFKYLNTIKEKRNRVYINNDIDIVRLPEHAKQEQTSRTRDFVDKKFSSYSYEREKNCFISYAMLIYELGLSDAENAKLLLNLFHAAIYRSTISYYAHLKDDYARDRYEVEGDINQIDFEKLEDMITEETYSLYDKMVKKRHIKDVIIIRMIKLKNRLELKAVMGVRNWSTNWLVFHGLHWALFHSIRILTE